MGGMRNADRRNRQTLIREESRKRINGTGEPDAVKSRTSGSEGGTRKRAAMYLAGCLPNWHTLGMETEALERLRAFRHEIYTTFGCRRDALVELLDALLTSPVIEHPVHLSLAPGFQRSWGRMYDALNAGTMPLPRLEHLVAEHPLETSTAWYAVDASLWPRNDAHTSAERGYSYHHQRPSHDESLIAGWNSSWLVQLPERCSRWTAKLARASDTARSKRQSGGRRADSLVPLPTRSGAALSHLHL
jgi:hypothetical protein